MNLRPLDIISIVIASMQAGIVAALGTTTVGFVLPGAVTFGLVVLGAMLAVVSANLPAVNRTRFTPASAEQPGIMLEHGVNIE